MDGSESLEIPEMAPTDPNSAFLPSIIDASHSTVPWNVRFEPKPVFRGQV
jgi:hypothetical protein